MRNKPVGSIEQVSIGPGRLLLGAADATPTVDVGYVRGSATLTFERNQVEIRQGSPQNLIKMLASQEDVMLEVTGIEWDFDNLSYVLGDGQTSISDPDKILEFGGRPNNTEVALQYLHTLPDGSTLTLNIWKANGDGNLAAALNPDDLHEFPYKFTAIDVSSDWAGNVLTNGKTLCKAIHTVA